MERLIASLLSLLLVAAFVGCNDPVDPRPDDSDDDDRNPPSQGYTAVLSGGSSAPPSGTGFV